MSEVEFDDRAESGRLPETIGELHDWLPPDVWVELPEHGVRVKRVGAVLDRHRRAET